MICVRCDNEDFITKPDAVIEQEFRNVRLDVHTPALACSNCGWITVGLDQVDELRKRTADAYRKKLGLLTSDAIRAIRKVLGMNQPAFAAFIGVGVASVKRWETWLVQEKRNDDLIRQKFAEYLRDAEETATLPALVSAVYTVPVFNFAVSALAVKSPRLKTLAGVTCEGDPSEMPFYGPHPSEYYEHSPPGRCGEAAFSLSAPFPNRSREDVEKENADQSEYMPSDQLITRTSYELSAAIIASPA